MAIQIRHINYVIAAADHGSFRRAAAAWAFKNSAISRRIRELEERLGTAFFIRSPSGVMLTHAGKQFVQRGRKAIRKSALQRPRRRRSAAVKTVTSGSEYSHHWRRDFYPT